LLRRQLHAGWSMKPLLTRVDLDADGEDEYLYALLGDDGLHGTWLYYRKADGWASAFVPVTRQGGHAAPNTESLLHDELELRAAPLQDMIIGDTVFHTSQVDKQADDQPVRVFSAP